LSRTFLHFVFPLYVFILSSFHPPMCICSFSGVIYFSLQLFLFFVLVHYMAHIVRDYITLFHQSLVCCWQSLANMIPFALFDRKESIDSSRYKSHLFFPDEQKTATKTKKEETHSLIASRCSQIRADKWQALFHWHTLIETASESCRSRNQPVWLCAGETTNLHAGRWKPVQARNESQCPLKESRINYLINNMIRRFCAVVFPPVSYLTCKSQPSAFNICKNLDKKSKKPTSLIRVTVSLNKWLIA
jgi:hypothetical protein